MTHGESLTDTELGRALLARQGLLERIDSPVTKVVARIGALQAQHWPAIPIALWSRVRGFSPAALYAALDNGELITGQLIRGTLHLVTATEYPAYAAMAAESGADSWQRSKAPPTEDMAAVRERLAAYAEQPRSSADLSEFAETTVAVELETNPRLISPEELEIQRSHSWRAFFRWSRLRRVPESGNWGAAKPTAYAAAPRPAAWSEAILLELVNRYLRAFGPASAADVAYWLGAKTPQVREALADHGDAFAHFTDSHDRPLFDLPDAPRPPADTSAPARLLPSFDSALLAYSPEHRTRILPEPFRDAVYQRRNLRILPTFLLDGLVAGTWTMQAKRRIATVELSPLRPLNPQQRGELEAEAESLSRAINPDVPEHRVLFA
ncbi:MAG: winged helix DNA-binding domain-containing protein [Mycobacteriales bacterium]